MVEDEREKRVQGRKVAGWHRGRSTSLLYSAHVMPDSASLWVGEFVLGGLGMPTSAGYLELWVSKEGCRTGKVWRGSEGASVASGAHGGDGIHVSTKW